MAGGIRVRVAGSGRGATVLRPRMRGGRVADAYLPRGMGLDYESYEKAAEHQRA